MPDLARAYGDKRVRPYLLGLLPEDPDARLAVARRLGVSPDSPFALLERMGLDCPGGVQLCPVQNVAKVLGREGALSELTGHDVEARLEQLQTIPQSGWTSVSERWSLGGAQSKIALREKDGRWYSCEGSAATTHILKPGVDGLHSQALDEYLCMRAAECVGIPVAKTDYRLFGSQVALVSERFDREVLSDGTVRRLHQEDLCQSFAVEPAKKYTSDGGPATNDVVALLKRSCADPARDLQAFCQMLLFQYLIAATDAHAKNYSIRLTPHGAVLCPLYDCASVLPYLDGSRRSVRLAMSIAGENRTGRLSASRLKRFAEVNGLGEYGLPGDKLVQQARELAQEVPAAFEDVAAEASDLPGAESLIPRLVPRVRGLCEQSLRLLV